MALFPPFPGAVSMLTLKGGTGYRSDSAALCDDGRIIYVWTNGDAILQTHYPNIAQFLLADNASAAAGTDISLTIDALGMRQPNTTVWRHPGGGLYLFVAYWSLAQFGSGLLPTQPTTIHTRVFSSPSGNGESAPGVPDWTLHGTVQDSPGDNSFGTQNQTAKDIGEPYITGSGRWVLTAPSYPRHAGVWTSDNSGVTWSLRQSISYPASGTAGGGQARNTVEYVGEMYWGATGNVDPAKGGYSSDNGTTWTPFTWPDTANSDWAAPLTSDGTGLYACFGGASFYGPNGIESTVDPPVTPRASRTVILAGLPGSCRCILQRVGIDDCYMHDGQILQALPTPPVVPSTATEGWG